MYDIDILAGSPTNNGMAPASVFDILTRSALTAHSAPGLRYRDSPFSTRLYRTYFAEEHTFFQEPEQAFYTCTYSIDLMIL